MRVTVFGASGKVGSLVVEAALQRGHTVVAFVHRRSPFTPSERLIIRKGDIYNAEDVDAALRGSEAVISCLSSWGTPRRDVLSSAMQAIIPAMERQGIKRIVTLTGIGVHLESSFLRAARGAILRGLGPLPAGKVFRDALRHVQLLEASELNWTTIGSSIMTNIGGARYRLSLKMELPIPVSRHAVAAAMVDQLEAADFLRQAPTIHRR